MPKPKKTTDQYDSPWKEALEEYFEESMAFFFPTIHADIDWTKKYEFLDKELEKIVRQAIVTEQHVDKLVQVYRLSGQQTWVLVHIDVQSQHETLFTKRMFQYHYRLFDRYDRPIVTLAIYGDEGSEWQPQKYEHNLWDCEVTFKFPSVKLIHYNIQELEQSNNPFALVVLAHLHTKATKNQPMERYNLRWRLTRLLYERGYDRARILSLYRYIDWLMALPPELEQKLEQQIEVYEEAQKMTYVTSAERIGYQRGIEAGLQQGREEAQKMTYVTSAERIGYQRGIEAGLQQGCEVGLQQGLQQGREVGELLTAREAVLEVLQIRFGKLSPSLDERLKLLNNLTILKQLLKKAVIIPSIADFEAELMADMSPRLELNYA